MNKFVYCDKCGHNFDISLSEIHKGDIIVQYLECPACKAKYHVCTTDTEMRRLIKKRLTILDKIAESREKVVPAGK
ncbi:MAG: hypothetical protein K2N49_01710 [Ruminococcus sp.]|nr:hypothetical protein [Ruminococcus sp.]